MKHPGDPISASELGLERGCSRKHAARYHSNWPRGPRKASFKVGERYHAIGERYFVHGEIDRSPDPVTDMFLNAMEHMPRPRMHWAIESALTVDFWGMPFHVQADWYGPSDALPGAARGYRAVADLKTTSDPKEYGVIGLAKKLDDPQTLIYSAALFANLPGIFRHSYARKTGQVYALEASLTDPNEPNSVAMSSAPTERERLLAKASKAAASQRALYDDVLLKPADVREAMERVVRPVALRVWQRRSVGKIDPLTVAPNAAECESYGGCPYRKMCNLTVADHINSLGGFSVSSFDMSSMFSQLPINGPSATPAPAAQPAPAVAHVFNFGAPVAAPEPTPAPVVTLPQELIDRGYKIEGNPGFCKTPHGTYAEVSKVLEAFENYKRETAAASAPVALGGLTPAQASMVPATGLAQALSPAQMVAAAELRPALIDPEVQRAHEAAVRANLPKLTDAELGAAVRALLSRI